MSYRDYVLAHTNPQRYDQLLEAEKYQPIVALPEMRVGDFSIRHITLPAEKRLPLLAGGFVRYSGEITLRQLFFKDSLWMSDTPSELSDMQELTRKADKGHVLVAGLGMGIVATMLAQKERVERVTVVEIAPEVVQMVSPYLPDNVTVITANFRQWVQTAVTGHYSAVILDIWGDISTDDLPDMLNLWEATGARRGGVWGLETLFYNLLDDLRGFYNVTDVTDSLRQIGLAAVADYLDEHCSSDEGWHDEDGEYQSDDALREAFNNCYGLYL